MTANAPANAVQRRINEALIAYWNELKGNRLYPSEGDIDPDAIADVWDACFLVKLSSRKETGHFQYTYLGSYLIEAYGDDLTDQEVCSHLVDPDSMPMVKKFEEVARNGEPMNDEGEFTNHNNVVIKYRSCLLPLGDPGKPVNYILGGMKWKLA